MTEGATYTFPATDGSEGQVLVTNGDGVLSWATVGAPPAHRDANLVWFISAIGLSEFVLAIIVGAFWTSLNGRFERHDHDIMLLLGRYRAVADAIDKLAARRTKRARR